MSLRYKRLEDINEQDLQALVDNKVSEGKEIEYKRDLPGNKPKGKKEFLADVSSFANAVGGDIVFGIPSKRGLPTQPLGIKIANVDKTNKRGQVCS